MARLDNFRLVVFRTVAEQMSFRKAAEELYLTQPAVSLQVKALEEELGVQLFDRSGVRIALTPAGAILLRRARRAGELLAQAELEIAALSGEHAGRLALGASTTIAQYVLPRLLAEFIRQNPRVQIALIGGNTEQVVEAAVEQRVDLGLIEGPARSRDVQSETFLRDELVLIVPAAHEWAERNSVAASDIPGAPLLMRERGSGTRGIVELALKKHGVQRSALTIAMELDSTEAIKSAVEAGLGVGFVSRWAIAKDMRLGQGFKIVEVSGMRLQRDFQLIHAKSPALRGLPEIFRRFLTARAAR